MTTTQILIAVVAILIALFLFAVWRAVRCPLGWRIWLIAVLMRLYVRVMLKWEAKGPCPFPQHGPAIIVGNHTSPVDPIVLWYDHNADWPGSQFRSIGFMVAAEYVSRKDPVGWACRSLESIPVKRSGRDMGAVRQAMARLAENKWLGVFPEGHINQKPEEGLKDFNTGAAFISLKSGVPVYPVFIHNAPRSRSMVKCFFKRTHVQIVYGEPIDVKAKYNEGKLAEKLEQATADIQAAVTELATRTA